MIRIEPRSVVVFAAALATSLACAGALRWMDGAGEAQAAIAAPSVVRSADGHYWAEAVVDGKPMRMLVDTGASVVTLSRADAEKAGVSVVAPLARVTPLAPAPPIVRVISPIRSG